MFESLSEEIQNLIVKLNNVNEEMTSISNSTPGLSTPAVIHTIQRHRDILQGIRIIPNFNEIIKCTLTTLALLTTKELY